MPKHGISRSRPLRRVRLLALLPFGALLGCAPAPIPEPEGRGDPAATEGVEVDLSHHFAAFNADGAFLLYDARADKYVVHDAERAGRRFLPASTFKILNSLIALETGALADQHEIIPWDGVDRGDWWNGDQAMTRAFQRSSV
jgi:beta-lactamase class D